MTVFVHAVMKAHNVVAVHVNQTFGAIPAQLQICVVLLVIIIMLIGAWKEERNALQ